MSWPIEICMDTCCSPAPHTQVSHANCLCGRACLTAATLGRICRRSKACSGQGDIKLYAPGHNSAAAATTAHLLLGSVRLNCRPGAEIWHNAVVGQSLARDRRCVVGMQPQYKGSLLVGMTISSNHWILHQLLHNGAA